MWCSLCFVTGAVFKGEAQRLPCFYCCWAEPRINAFVDLLTSMSELELSEIEGKRSGDTWLDGDFLRLAICKVDFNFRWHDEDQWIAGGQAKYSVIITVG